MKLFTIAYDLKAPNDSGADYERVIGGIKYEFPDWAHIEKSVFCVRAQSTASQVRDRVQTYLNSEDKLTVFESYSWAWNGNLPQDVADWLRRAA